MTITEIAEKYQVNPETIRYYERIGLIPPIPRKGNRRYFDEEAQDWVEMVLCLRNSGVSIEKLQEYCDLYRQGDETIPERKAVLEEQASLLKEKQQSLQVSINRLEKKIKKYNQKLGEK